VDLVRVYSPVGPGTSSTVSFVVFFLVSMGVVARVEAVLAYLRRSGRQSESSHKIIFTE